MLILAFGGLFCNLMKGKKWSVYEKFESLRMFCELEADWLNVTHNAVPNDCVIQ